MEEKPRTRTKCKTSSFSSTLLDSIYRSFDNEPKYCELKPKPKREGFESEVMNKNNQNNFRGVNNSGKWIEKEVQTERFVNIRRNSSIIDFDHRKLLTNDRSSPSSVFLDFSSSSSADSSSGFSSSDVEPSTVYKFKSKRSSSVPTQRPKPLKISGDSGNLSYEIHQNEQRNQSKTKAKNFMKTKTRALKIYSDLTQPISPGGKLASFINSIFTPKKTKIYVSVGGGHQDDSIRSELGTISKEKSEQTTPRSNKQPCSNKKQISRIRRSIKFYPVNVVPDGDFQSFGHKSLDFDLEFGLNDNKNGIVVVEEVVTDVCVDDQDEDGEDKENEDRASCTSSDLFEIDDLGVIGLDR